MFGKGVQRAHSLDSVSQPTVDEMQSRPILDEYGERKTAPIAPRPLGRHGFLPLGRRVSALLPRHP